MITDAHDSTKWKHCKPPSIAKTKQQKGPKTEEKQPLNIVFFFLGASCSLLARPFVFKFLSFHLLNSRWVVFAATIISVCHEQIVVWNGEMCSVQIQAVQSPAHRDNHLNCISECCLSGMEQDSFCCAKVYGRFLAWWLCVNMTSIYNLKTYWQGFCPSNLCKQGVHRVWKNYKEKSLDWQIHRLKQGRSRCKDPALISPAKRSFRRPAANSWRKLGWDLSKPQLHQPSTPTSTPHLWYI